MKHVNILSIILILLLFVQCGDDDNETPASVLSLTSTSATVNENAGIVTLEIGLSAPVVGSGELSYSLSGSANLNGDFAIIDSSPLTVNEGAESIDISFRIIDDEIIEILDAVENGAGGFDIVPVTEQTLIVELASVSGNLQLPSDGERTFTYNIIDNDEPPSSGMKWDLAWNVEESGDVDAVNLDMVAIYDVVVENNTITDAQTFAISANTSGYENLIVDNSAPDSDYYLVVEYTDGMGDAAFIFWSYHTDVPVFASDVFTQQTADDGFVLIFGPIATKSGSTFSRKGQSQIEPTLKRVRIDQGILQ
ncbi:MAG: hypothetical protein AAGF85_14665 [Bacteroidota bacterium]